MHLSLLFVDNCKVFPSKPLKILGVQFLHTLDWTSHVNLAIRKANSMIYALRYLNSKLLREHFKTLIHAHFLSKLIYASQTWSGCISLKLRRRLDSCYYKVLRLLCRDFKGKKSRSVLLEQSKMSSLRAMFFRNVLKPLMCAGLLEENNQINLINILM